MEFANLYGPIEITLDCTYFKIERELRDEEPIPIGFPCRNTGILILDENNQQVIAENVEGELCVRGTSLAMGYYNNPEKTAAAFVQNPLNKSYPEIIYRTGDIVFINERREIVFKGRRDSLVKHLGYRIELGEIEHVIINKLKLVKNGCIVYKDVYKRQGVCSACLNYENRKNIDYKKRWEEFKLLCDKYRRMNGANGYDCMIAVSGGKDSHFQVYIMKEVMGMNPLLVTVEDNFPMTRAGMHNLKNISEAFGCDIISMKPNIKMCIRDRFLIFVQNESLIRAIRCFN